MGDRNFKCFEIDDSAAADTFRSSDDVDALSGINSRLDICCTVGSWDYNICIFGFQKSTL